MSGVKGRSGRRTKSEEEKRREVLQMAWKLHYDYLGNPDISTVDKLKYANPILLKDMIEKTDNKTTLTTKEAETINSLIDNRVNLHALSTLNANGTS